MSKKPCDCDKPTGAPRDSVRNAAALWTSAGKVIGYAEAVDWATAYLHGQAGGIIDAAGLKLKKKDRAKLVACIEAAAIALKAGNDGRRTEADVLGKTAVSMVNRLEQRKPGFLRRVGAALVSLRG